MIAVTYSTLALVANPYGKSTAVLCISGLVSAMYIQLILHCPNLGVDLPLLSMIMLSLRYAVVQIRCPGQVEVGHGPGTLHKKMQWECRATGRKHHKESQQSSDGVRNEHSQGGGQAFNGAIILVGGLFQEQKLLEQGRLYHCTCRKA